jgi:transposase
METRMSLARLRDEFGVSRDTMTEWLRGLPAPEWTRRPMAKDELRAQAVELREQGCSVPDIATRLGVSKSSAYLWTRHIPLDRSPEEGAERRRRQMEQMREARWEPHRRSRDAERSETGRDQAAWVGALSDREIRLLGAVAYWCEGGKEKPWRRHNCAVQFINSDESLIRLFLRFMEVEGADRAELTYRLSIHESADVEAATRSWAAVVGIPAESFRRPTLKKHNPRTVRRNVGDSYRGCLIIYVPKSTRIYWRIEGIMAGIALSEGLPA